MEVHVKHEAYATCALIYVHINDYPSLMKDHFLLTAY